MTLTDFQTLLETTGLPVAYDHFTKEYIEKEGVTLPFIVWMNESDDNFGADNVVHYVAHGVRIELYEEVRDPVTEGKVETALKDIYYTKEAVYIEDERLYEIIYQTEV